LIIQRISVFKEFEFIVPPLEIQKKYQSVKSQVKALQKNHQLADEMNLFSSLQNQAFNGTL
ncbi:restriction endonuclease subunit S, partial [Acinetobacter baumannii]